MSLIKVLFSTTILDVFSVSNNHESGQDPGGGGTPLYTPYRYVPFYTQYAVRVLYLVGVLYPVRNPSPQSAVYFLYWPDIQPCDVLSGSFSSIQPISFPEAEILLYSDGDH